MIENNPLINKSYRYTYDSYGNIYFKKEYAYTTGNLPTNPLINHAYSYSATYPNRLISFDGQSITYDTVGNPLTYLGKSMSWIKGTLLSSVNEGNNYINLYYDGFNQRIRKETDSETTYYRYIDNKLISEENNSYTITFLYSHIGITGFIFNNVIYYYEKNIMQDVINIRNSNNVIVASYIYDAFGNHKVLNTNGTINTSSSFIGNINPIRYRSYYFDKDLKMYWLTTRYYDPEVGRFISPDHYSYLNYQKLHGLNLYAYSKNNPVMYYDPSGHSFILTMIAGIAIGVAGALLLFGLKSDSPTPRSSGKSEIPTGDDAIKYNEDPYKGNGFIVYYGIKEDEDEDKYLLQVYESWKLSSEQMREFLEYLQSLYPEMYLNIDKIMNEWAWHNFAFSLGIDPDASGSVDVYFNHDDDDHWYSFVLNWRLWY